VENTLDRGSQEIKSVPTPPTTTKKPGNTARKGELKKAEYKRKTQPFPSRSSGGGKKTDWGGGESAENGNQVHGPTRNSSRLVEFEGGGKEGNGAGGKNSKCQVAQIGDDRDSLLSRDVEPGCLSKNTRKKNPHAQKTLLTGVSSPYSPPNHSGT